MNCLPALGPSEFTQTGKAEPNLTPYGKKIREFIFAWRLVEKVFYNHKKTVFPLHSFFPVISGGFGQCFFAVPTKWARLGGSSQD